MKNVFRVLLAVGGLVLLGALSRISFTPQQSGAALLRLSWRTRGEALQQCRNRTTAELEALPVHMRTPQICTGRVANYQLSVRIDDGPPRTRELRAAGARTDRPIYVLWQDTLTPGRHEIDVEFYSVLHPDRRGLRFHDDIEVERGDIALITHDDEHNRLFLRRERRHDDEKHDRDD
jgi:hypothetical protein